MIDDPKRNQGQTDQSSVQDEGSAGGVASQDIDESGKMGDLGNTDLSDEDMDDDLTQ